MDPPSKLVMSFAEAVKDNTRVLEVLIGESEEENVLSFDILCLCPIGEGEGV